MKYKKFFIGSSAIASILPTIGVVSYYDDEELYNNNIEETNYTTLELLKEIKKIYPNLEISSNTDSNYNNNLHNLSYSFKRQQPFFSLNKEFKNSKFIKSNSLDLVESKINSYNNFNDFWKKLKKELSNFKVVNQDIFNISENTKNALFINDLKLKSTIESKTLSVDVSTYLPFTDTISGATINNSYSKYKLSNLYFYEYSQYLLTTTSNQDLGLYEQELSPKQNSKSYRPSGDYNAFSSLIIKNNEYWPSIIPLKIEDFEFNNDKLRVKQNKDEFYNNQINSLYNLNLFNKIKNNWSNLTNKYLVKSEDRIKLISSRFGTHFDTKISFLDEEDIKKYALEKFLLSKGVKKINNNWNYDIEFDDYVEYISSLGTKVQNSNIYRHLTSKLSNNIKFIYSDRPYVEVIYTEFNANEPIKIFINPSAQNSNKNTYWWERFKINIPKLSEDTSENSVQQVFSLKEGIAVPVSDEAHKQNQYNYQKLDNNLITLVSAASINLFLSPKNNEELIINDRVVPISLIGFIYKILPTDQKLKIQVKEYKVEAGKINRNEAKVYTITENLFKDIELNKVFDEIDFKLHSWDPKINFDQAQKINPYQIDSNFKEIVDKDGNLISNPDYDFKINPKTGTYEQIWTLSSKFYKQISNLKIWPKISKLNESKLVEYFGEENNSVIVKTIFADAGLHLQFDDGFKEIKGFYFGNDLADIQNIQEFNLTTDSQGILYFAAPKTEGWYLLNAIQKTGLPKFYLIYQTNQKFKDSQEKNILDNAFIKLNQLNLVNNLENSKFFTSFKEFLNNKSLDINSLNYSDLIIQYENFLLYKNISFSLHFNSLKQEEFINDFEKYLVDNNKLSNEETLLYNSLKPELQEYKQLLADFIESKMQNDKNQTNIYSYLNSKPISLVEAEKFEYLNSDNDKEVNIYQNDSTLNVYSFNFNYNLQPNSTIIKFIKDEPTQKIDLTSWLSKKGYKINWPINIFLDKDKIKQKLEQRTLSDWKNNINYLQEFILKSISGYSIGEGFYNLDFINENGTEMDVDDYFSYFDNTFFLLNGKSFNLGEILKHLFKPKISLTNNSIYIFWDGLFELNDEKFIITKDSNTTIEIEYPKFSNPLDFLEISDLSYDNFSLAQLKEDLKSDNLFNNFNYETEYDNNHYEYDFKYLQNFKIKNLDYELDLLSSEEYTKYLDLNEKPKSIIKQLILSNTNSNFIFEKTLKEIKDKNLIENKEFDFNRPKNELIVALKSVIGNKYDLINKKYTFLKEVIDYWIDKTNKSFAISNHKKSLEIQQINELLSKLTEFKFVLVDKHNQMYWNNINQFIQNKKMLFNYISSNIEKFKYTTESIENFKIWLEFANKLKNSHKKDVLFNLWRFLEVELDKISQNKLEKIRLFSHIYTKLNIENVINGIYDGLKLVDKPYQEFDKEKIKENIFNNETINSDYYLLKTNISLISPLKTITGEYNLKSYIFSNLKPSQLIDEDYIGENDINRIDNRDDNDNNNPSSKKEVNNSKNNDT
ncbi:hypothetical protein, partial [Mycoplasma sp. CSL7503-lung]|uniref:hypothetical protein n=1 Tax=Mycoplasma sp. CSL7503-lung TaxID=536372 RepID=UPI0021CF227C